MRKLCVLLLTLLPVACGEEISDPVLPEVQPTSTLAAAGNNGNSGGENMKVNAVVSDSSCTKAPLVSTCSASTTTGYGARFGNCLPVTPTGSSYALTDSASINLKQSKNGNLVQSVTFWEQDVPGPAGIMHTSDPAAVAVPVQPTPSGFTLHVHRDNVPVWRMSGHTGGKKVEIIGMICIGDLVYSPAN